MVSAKSVSRCGDRGVAADSELRGEGVFPSRALEIARKHAIDREAARRQTRATPSGTIFIRATRPP